MIRLKCSELIVKERLSSRIKDSANYSIANINDYLWMKENASCAGDNLVDVTINAEKILKNKWMIL